MALTMSPEFTPELDSRSRVHIESGDSVLVENLPEGFEFRIRPISGWEIDEVDEHTAEVWFDEEDVFTVFINAPGYREFKCEVWVEG